MKITTPLTATVTTAATASGFNNTNSKNTTHTGRQAPGHTNRLDQPEAANAEQLLKNRIGQANGGKELIKFCRELSVILIRSYKMAGDQGDTGELREKLAASLMVTLNCTEKQALCLIELSLELIHAKLKGRYKRSEVDLSYLIATATGAVSDVSSN